MENVILCNGRYAVNPHFLIEENLRLYSVEELCYFLHYSSLFLIINYNTNKWSPQRNHLL